jgi:putative ABC transport system permease protein
MITLDALSMALCALLVLLLAAASWLLRLGLARSLLVAALRMAVQLALVGLVLEAVFGAAHLGWVALIALVMLAIAGREAGARLSRPFVGGWRYGIGLLAMSLSSLVTAIFALAVVIGPEPWWTPQYAIPLLGMLLGNTLNGVALSLDRLSGDAWRRRGEIEARLMLGHSWQQASGELQRDAARAGMMPIINAMAVAGVVSLPGMMTGQILAGSPPMEAVRYQIMILAMIAVGSGLGTFATVWLGTRRLFDRRDRLRLDRLYSAEH